jgi:hypothetical protein
MGQVRSFLEYDIPQVADLFVRVFVGGKRPSPPPLRSYYEETFFHNPWYDEALPSLVYEDHRGEISGFLGVIPRPMSLNGCALQAAISMQFMVEPASRSSLAAVQLLKTFLSGPQDLSITDGANDSSRKIWERLGGTTAYPLSLRWIYPLRPSLYGVSLLKQYKPLASFAGALNPFCRIVDALATVMPQSPLRRLAPQVSGEKLTAETLLACLSAYTAGRSLRPEYDTPSLTWLLEKLAQKRVLGTLRQIAVRGTGQEILGCYLYYLNPSGIGEVAQIIARERSATEVLDHLFYDAWLHGIVALKGRLDPKLIQELSVRHCLFHFRGPWTLVHSHNSEVLQAFYVGDAFLTQLEGEWWLGFREFL